MTVCKRGLVASLLAAAVGFSPVGAVAQSSDILDCAAENTPEYLASSMVDEIVAGQKTGATSATPARDQGDAIIQECLNEAGLSDEVAVHYRLYSLMRMVAPEVERRLVEQGVDFAELEATVTSAVLQEPDDSEAVLVLIAGTAEQHLQGVQDRELTSTLVGFYIANEMLMRSSLRQLPK